MSAEYDFDESLTVAYGTGAPCRSTITPATVAAAFITISTPVVGESPDTVTGVVTAGACASSLANSRYEPAASAGIVNFPSLSLVSAVRSPAPPSHAFAASIAHTRAPAIGAPLSSIT